MLTLLHALQEQGPDLWQVIAQAWEIAYPDDARDPLAEIIAAMLDPERVAAHYRALPPAAREALGALRSAGGKIPVAEFVYRYGEIRSMGAGRRQREQPWRAPVSLAEQLWYGGWLGRTFLRAGNTAQEYIFLPADLEALIPAGMSAASPGWRLLSYQPAHDEKVTSTGLHAVGDACTLLAYLRNWPQSAHRETGQWIPQKPLGRHLREADCLPLLVGLCKELGILGGDPIQPETDGARDFLERGRNASAAVFLRAWKDSRAWNDLERMGGITADGGWPNDPASARRNFLATLRAMPRGEWCTLESAIASLRENALEFLRPASEFESWMLRDSNGEMLAGLNSWERVEGVLARFLITGPLTWLGAVDLVPDGTPKAFRITPLAGALWEEAIPEDTERAEPALSRLQPDGTILVPDGVPLLLRYQLARCSDWIARQGGVRVYRITPRSMNRARGQGVRTAHVLPLLEKLAGRVPPAFGNALKRWERNGAEALVRSARILTVKSAAAAEKISGKMKHLKGLADPIEEPVWILSPASGNRMRSFLIGEGFLMDEDEEED